METVRYFHVKLQRAGPNALCECLEDLKFLQRLKTPEIAVGLHGRIPVNNIRANKRDREVGAKTKF